MKKVLTQTYIFNVIIEPDEDGWFAYCPALESHGAATWGQTKEEAAKKIQEVLEMVVEDMLEDGEKVPIEPVRDRKKILFNPLVTIRV